MDDREAKKNTEVMLSLGGSFSEIAEFLKDKGVKDPSQIIRETVEQWVDEDNQLSSSRRAVQRRRLQRQVRLAMDSERVGDAVRAEAILARLDDQEADAEAGKTQNDFDVEMENRSEEEIEFFVNKGRFPNPGEMKANNPPPVEDDSVH